MYDDKELLEAVAEARAIATGEIKTRVYHTVQELIDELTAEADAEEEAERGGKKDAAQTTFRNQRQRKHRRADNQGNQNAVGHILHLRYSTRRSLSTSS